MRLIPIVTISLLLFGCVDHRPIRNGLSDESIYLEKEDLTAPNPKLGENSQDDGWLYRINIIEASDPNITESFPGYESSTRYVRFRFREDALQVTDAQLLQSDDPDNPNDDDLYRADTVIMEFPGKHVDIKLRESLDGERSNHLEENTEENWKERQQFKVDFEEMKVSPEDAIGAINGYFFNECAKEVSTQLVPDSYKWDKEDQYLSFNVEVNYKLNVAGYLCYSWAFLGQHTFDTNVIDSGTIVYKFNFYRTGPSDFKPVLVDEKDPVNKKYGVFQNLNLYTDTATGLLGGKRLMKIWNPDQEEITYYFAKGFPEKFKHFFTGAGGIQENTNAVLSEGGGKMRVAFKEYNDGGIERELGDIRYSFVTWFQNHNANGPLGYGPSTSDPRTGEIISANVNGYNYAYSLLGFLAREFLTDAGAEEGIDLEGSCEPGTIAKPADEKMRLDSALFDEMRFVMDFPEEQQTGTSADFIPEPKDPRFLEILNRILPEARYSYPGWNAYTYRNPQQMDPHAFAEMMIKEAEFRQTMDAISMGENPFGTTPLYSADGIEQQNEFREQFQDWKKNHREYNALKKMIKSTQSIYEFEPGNYLHDLSRTGRLCKDDGKWESNDEYAERFTDNVMHHIYIHEFGHTLGLRHNFYGSTDRLHHREGEVSNSVMDYISIGAEAGTKHEWGLYDEWALKWIYGSESTKTEAMEQKLLYCTDEHRILSPMCRAYDYGATPAEVVLNDIENYDWNYKYRNRRAYRQFWNTGGYYGRVYNSIFPVQRAWYLGIFDWSGGGIQQILKRLDQVDGQPILEQIEYDEMAIDIFNDLAVANEMILAYYDAIINQSASFRNYQTEFDPFYGDIRRIGIINDKLFATFAFMDLQEVYYSPNIYTYAAMYDSPIGTRAARLSERVLDNMLGANYDTFPWFKYYALNIFASVVNSNLVDDIALKERIAIWRFNSAADLHERFPEEAIAEALRDDNSQQTFLHKGEEYVYTYLEDRAWHLVARKTRSPVSFQYIRDYNDSLYGGADRDKDTYALKILLAYHDYYNNFVGF